MTEEELELVAALRRQRKIQYQAIYNVGTAPERHAKRRAQRAERNAPRLAAEKERRDAALAEDLAAADALQGSRARLAAQLERDRINAIAADVRNKAKSQQRFFCSVCEKPFATDFALDKHLASEAHQRKVDGVALGERHKYADNTKAARQVAKANKQHWCPVCNKSYDTDWSLKRHRAESKKHQRLVEAAEALRA